jgi:hypothetical protein
MEDKFKTIKNQNQIDANKIIQNENDYIHEFI